MKWEYLRQKIHSIEKYSRQQLPSEFYVHIIFSKFLCKLGVILMSPTGLSDLKYFLGVLSKSSYFYLLSAIN